MEVGRRLEALFHEAIALDATARVRMLAQLRSEDEQLAGMLAELLAADRDAHTVALRGRVVESHAAPLPEQIGAFRIVGVVGEGGMGTVLRGEQSEPVRRTVAIKLLRSGFANNPVAAARFDLERRTLALMEHPHIARVLEAGTAPDGRSWLAMEFVDGPPITNYCRDRALDTRARVRLLIDVCGAVEHAHRRGVLHRDLKPSNVLVADGDQGPWVKVIDFGIAKAVADDETQPQLTIQGLGPLGTPQYMSPEQARGDPSAIDTRSDIWALGVLMYELLAGELPFVSDTRGPLGEHDVFRRIVEDEPRPPSRVGNDGELDSDLDAIVACALRKDPDRRYPTAAALADDLQRWLQNEPITARTPSRRERVARTWRRHRTAITAIVGVFLALAIGLAVSLWMFGLAQARLGDYRRMADSQLVAELEAAAETELWPPWPDHIPALRVWLATLDSLRARVPVHRAMLAGLDEPSRDLDLRERNWIRRTIDELVRRVDAIDRTGGLGDDVRARLESAERLARVEAETVLLWARAIDEIADPLRSPRYAGLRIVPQPGLVPLGRNRVTGLGEFWHVLSGVRPQWRDDGTTSVRPEDGIVLVLVPGGRTAIGCARMQSGGGEVEMADERAGAMESPVHTVELDAYFIAKYEVTQAQWMRATGSNPSRFQEGVALPRGVATPTHPVEQVDWNESVAVLHRLGLELPTEAQWERACRSGTRTSFWCGLDPRCAFQIGCNIADSGSRGTGPQDWPWEEGYDDGHTVHAPVGSFAVNPFGIYDMHGNVAEWCRDFYRSYESPTRRGDGLRDPSGGTDDARAVRGGSFYSSLAAARSPARTQAESAHKVAYRGLRAAARLR